MFDLFKLEYYKNYLISYYKYNYDNTEEMKLKRQEYIESSYSDEELIDIIENTKEFIFNIINNIKEYKTNYLSIDLISEHEIIRNNCTGGFYPDILIPIDELDEEKLISRYLLKLFLGNNFNIFIDHKEEEILDDEFGIIIGCVYQIPRLVITGDFNELLNKYNLNEETSILKRKK